MSVLNFLENVQEDEMKLRCDEVQSPSEEQPARNFFKFTSGE